LWYEACLSFYIYIYTYTYIYVYIYSSTGVWTQGLHLKPLYQQFFVMGSFEIGSHHGLFVQAGFKPQSSWSLPPELLGLQVWVTGAQLHSFNFINLRTNKIQKMTKLRTKNNELESRHTIESINLSPKSFLIRLIHLINL
jgi:hypothetical protein